MAAYDYRCEQHGVFELTAPLGTAPTTADCPECGADAARIFSAPNLSTPRDSPFIPIGPSPNGAGAPPPPGFRPSLSQLPSTAGMRPSFPPRP